MATKNKNRVRNRIINFRVTPSEYEEIQARIKVCGMPKGEMVDIANECKALLNQLIIITKDNQKLSQDDFITKKKP